MNTYLFQVNRKTTSHGLAYFEVQAESETEAKQLFTKGIKHEVDDHINSYENEDADPEIINCRKNPESLLDHIN